MVGGHTFNEISMSNYYFHMHAVAQDTPHDNKEFPLVAFILIVIYGLDRRAAWSCRLAPPPPPPPPRAPHRVAMALEN